MIDTKTLPKNPGCYIYKDSAGKIIYVGKARDIKKRVESYFTRHHDPKTNVLVSGISSVDFIVTSSEVEALILENNLIKKHNPKYNINLKDSKRYAYLEITLESFPRLLLARKREKGDYYGPFTSAEQRDYVLSLLQRSFQLRTCKKMPRKPCLRFHINLCSAPCSSHISEQEYIARIERIRSILSGGTKGIVQVMEKEMVGLSKSLLFEQALALRDQISAVKCMGERQLVERQKSYDEDIINYVVKDNKVFLMLFNISMGVLHNKKEFEFERTSDFLQEFVIQYYAENDIPRELIVPQAIDASVGAYLARLAERKVRVLVPVNGEKKALLDLVMANIDATFFGDEARLAALRDCLNLQDLPRVIECFDISHISGTSTVGSMVQFRNAKPDKSNYRRFRIRTVRGIDDARSVAEVVFRRYRRLKGENSSLPDLIVIDGGKAQLNFALAELSKLELKLPVIALAKRFEEVYLPGISFPVKPAGKALLFLKEMRNEAHRFAIKYSRLLRAKSSY